MVIEKTVYENVFSKHDPIVIVGEDYEKMDH